MYLSLCCFVLLVSALGFSSGAVIPSETNDANMYTVARLSTFQDGVTVGHEVTECYISSNKFSNFHDDLGAMVVFMYSDNGAAKEFELMKGADELSARDTFTKACTKNKGIPLKRLTYPLTV